MEVNKLKRLIKKAIYSRDIEKLSNYIRQNARKVSDKRYEPDCSWKCSIDNIDVILDIEYSIGSFDTTESIRIFNRHNNLELTLIDNEDENIPFGIIGETDIGALLLLPLLVKRAVRG